MPLHLILAYISFTIILRFYQRTAVRSPYTDIVYISYGLYTNNIPYSNTTFTIHKRHFVFKYRIYFTQTAFRIQIQRLLHTNGIMCSNTEFTLHKRLFVFKCSVYFTQTALRIQIQHWLYTNRAAYSNTEFTLQKRDCKFKYNIYTNGTAHSDRKQHYFTQTTRRIQLQYIM